MIDHVLFRSKVCNGSVPAGQQRQPSIRQRMLGSQEPLLPRENMNQFDIVKMASGGLALVLEATSTWEEFPTYARKWTRRLNARPLAKPVVTFDECMAEIALTEGKFLITYDDFQSSIQLEPKDSRHNNIVIQLQAELRHARDDDSRS